MNILILASIAALLSGVLAAVIAILVVRNINDKDPNSIYSKQVNAIIGGMDEEDDYLESEAPGPIDRWNIYWGKLFKEVSPNYSPDDGRAGMTTILIWGAVFGGVLIFLQNILAALLFATVVVIGISITLTIKSRQKDHIIRNQLTGFLFALKANVSANLTPERAMMKIIDNMPSPLWEELAPVKNQILSNISFRDALDELRKRTTSDDLKFLCSCIIMATASGANLESQLDIIRESVDQKKRLSEEIAQATKAATMNTYAASIIIPIGFIGTYILDERAREFWFIDPISWAALGAVALLYGLGVFMSRKFVSKVRKL